MSNIWKPSVTVAAVICQDDRFLMVEEESADGIRLNQPAGHLDEGESLIDAVVRETREETAYAFTPDALIGMYMSRSVSSTRAGLDATYLRFAFTGKLGEQSNAPLDTGIIRTLWMSRAELAACTEKHRSPLVLQCIDDYIRGQRAPLDLLYTHTSVNWK
jgi:8-oxo-dGTP pyrophosphatase MutT (NUDIX family)